MAINETDESRRYVEFLERLTAAPEQERAWLTMEFSLQSLPESIREMVWAAAVPHWFDREYLAALLGRTPSEADYAALLELSYVEVYPGRGHAIHEHSRKLLLDKLWQTDRKRYRQFATRAAAHCSRKNQRDALWKVEWIYHRLLSKPEAGTQALIHHGWQWQNSPQFAYDKLEMLARAAEEHREAGRLDRRAAAWALFWQALIDQVYSRYREAKEKLLQIPLFPKQDPFTAACCMFYLGNAQRVLSEIPEARQRYEQALLLYRILRSQQGEAHCLQSLGDVCLQLSEIEAARAYYQQALPIYQAIGEQVGEAYCLHSLGDVCLALSEMEAAREHYEKALSISQTIGNRLGKAMCLRSLGDVCLRLSQMESARAYHQQALTIYQVISGRVGEANCLQSLGDVCLRLSEMEAAREYYEKALSIDQAIGERMGEAHCLKSFGDYHRQMQAFESAQESYQAAAALFAEIGNREGEAECWEGFAKLYETQGETGKAREVWEQAAALYEALGMPKRAQPCADAAKRLDGSGTQ
jgi:tetratricopeptide (TPR) repeat protein